MVFSSGVFAEAPGLLPRITTPLPIAQRKHAHVRFTCRHELPFCFGVFFFIKWYLLAIWTYKTQARIDLRVRLSTALSHHHPAKHAEYARECQQPGTKTAPCLRLHRRAAVFLMHPHLPIYLNLKQEKKKKKLQVKKREKCYACVLMFASWNCAPHGQPSSRCSAAAHRGCCAPPNPPHRPRPRGPRGPS